jgi:hypothetical protein
MTAHRALLAFNSEYFETAFYGSLKSVDSVYIMPEAEVAGVRGFVSWTDTGVFKCFRTDSDQDYEQALLKCWVTGDMLLAPQFANEVMRGLCDWYGEDRVWPCVGSVRYIYDNTPPSSVLLQFIKDVTIAWVLSAMMDLIRNIRRSGQSSWNERKIVYWESWRLPI